MSKKTAVVVGALGVIGRYIVERLVAEGDWDVIGLSRRTGEDGPRVRFIPVDLLDEASVAAKLSGLTETSHIFYAAFQPVAGAATGFASNIAPNRDMLVNAVTAIDAASEKLQRVVLVTGTKYYGMHLGPFRTPARESDPRHIGPNYYFDQVDWLRDYQRGKRWDWVELRPHALCGFAPGTAQSILPAIAVYAALSKELGLPPRFPGKPGAFHALYQATASEHMAAGALWAATEPRCANEAFNMTNGDIFRWANVWPRIADVFEMPAGGVQTIKLVEQMAALRPLWERMVERYGLRPIPWEQLAAWPFADYVFAVDYDSISSMTKARQYGFHDVVDSEEMFVRLLRQFRREKIVP
jgi:nucleoside-diphosphate-sugar epimerase